MKTKIVITIIAIVGMFGLAGCKPKTTTLTGQVFIVTQGGDNIKLGDVEILLVDKSQVADFLQKKQITIKGEMATRKQAVLDVEKEIESLEKEQASSTNGSYETNVDYVKIKSEYDALLSQTPTLNQKDESLRNARDAAGEVGNKKNFDAIQGQIETLDQEMIQNHQEMESLQEKLNDIKSDYLAKLSVELETAQSRLSAAKIKFEGFPIEEDYFNDFSPTILQKTISDADGKFSFVYFQDKPLTIFASAQRSVSNGTERYYWLIDAPTDTGTVQVLLSNNNFVSVDPDGYFAAGQNPNL